MAYITPRCYAIVSILLQESKPVTIAELSRELSVSERSIRYDLDALEDWLGEQGIRLVRKSRVGISLDGEAAAYGKLKERFVQPKLANQQVYSVEERRAIMLVKILNSPQPVTMGKLAKLSNVSTSTVKRDLEAVEETLAAYRIRLESRTNSGVRAWGGEMDMREALANTLLQGQEKPLMTGENALQGMRMPPLFPGLTMGPVGDCLALLEKELKISFSDAALGELYTYIAIGRNRMAMGKFVQLDEAFLQMLREGHEFTVFLQATEILTEDLDVSPPKEEAAYLAMHALGAGINRSQGGLMNKYAEAGEAVDRFIMAVSLRLGLDLTGDGELRSDLMMDMRPWLFRAKFGMGRERRPLEIDARLQLQEVFQAVSLELPLLERHFDVHLDREAVTNLTLHVAAARERRQQVDSYKYISAIVVCGAGMGTAKLLSSRIRREYRQIKVLQEFSLAEFRGFDCQSVDMVFSTIPMEPGENIITVDPLLTGESKEKINRFLDERMSRHENRERYLSKIMMIIENHCEILNKETLKNDLEQFLYVQSPPEYTAYAPAFNALITRKTVALNAVAADYREAIAIGGRLLLRNGLIKEDYIQSMITHAEKYRSNVVIMPAVALPHAIPDGNVKELCMSMTLLKEPVPFGHSAYDPVKLVICLGAVDSRSHEKAMGDLLTLLQNEYLLQRIMGAQDIEEILLAVNAVH